MSIHRKGKKYREQWRAVFLDSLHLPDDCIAGEVGVYDADLGPVFFSVVNASNYHIIDGAKLNRDDRRLHAHDGDALDLAKNFKDGYFDFLYIDSCTSYLDTLQKLGAWWPKVKNGGWMTGHDWTYKEGGRKHIGTEVREAVYDFAKSTLEGKTGKLDTKWIRFQEKKLPEITKGEWRIKKVGI
jgi:hypothetical protein